MRVPSSLLASVVLLLASAATASAADATRPLLRDLLGINAHPVQFKPAAYRLLTAQVRDYHPLEWDIERSDAVPKFPFARNGVDWSALYGAWKQAGYATHSTLLFDNLQPGDWRSPENDARAYGLAYAQAFGPSAAVPLVASVEVGSEPGAYGNDLYRTLFSGMAGGLRAGDPQLRIATCAVTAGPSTRHARSVECFRGLERLVDVITVHASAQLDDWPTWHVTNPEDPAAPFLKEIRGVLAWRDRNAPAKPVWVTEFGWDSTTKRPASDSLWARWAGVTDQQQAQWLVRAVLLFTTLDVQRAYVFTFDDRDEPAFRASSGLTRNGTPKPSFHALAHLVATLGDHRLSGVVRQDDAAVVLRFRDGRDEQRTVLVLWSPTGDGRSVQFTQALPSDRKPVRMQRMPLGADTADLPLPALAADGTVTVTLDESPLYLWLEPR